MFHTLRRAPARRRVVTLAVVAGLHLLLILLLLLLAPQLPKGGERAAMEAFNIRAPAATPAAPKPTPQRQRSKAPTQPRTSPVPRPIVTVPSDSNWTIGDPALAGFDLRKAPRAPADEATGEQVAQASDESPVVGTAPDGSKLYRAEWQREPTEQELAFYVKDKAQRGAWGVIACKTAARYTVEDCREIDEWPRGSGLSRAIVAAAWQFRVKPPRLNGEPMIGSWVSIRISFGEEG